MWYQTCHSHGLSLCPYTILNSMFSPIMLQLFKKSDFFKTSVEFFFNVRYVGWIPNVLLLWKRGVFLTTKSLMTILDVLFFFILDFHLLAASIWAIFFSFYWSIVDLQHWDNLYCKVAQIYIYIDIFFSMTVYYQILITVLCAIQ